MKKEMLDTLMALSRNTGDDVPIAAIVYNEMEEIISAAANDCESDDSPLRHAEILALDKALKIRKHSLRGCTLLVTLEPCLMCYGAAVNADISAIIYLVRNSDNGAFSYYRADTQKNKIVICCLESAEAKNLLRDFFVENRKKV